MGTSAEQIRSTGPSRSKNAFSMMMEPERFLSWRWHPGAAEPGESFSHETPTLVEFELREVPGGTLLTVVESGFDQLPIARREKAFRDNSQGWAAQMEAIERHLG